MFTFFLGTLNHKHEPQVISYDEENKLCRGLSRWVRLLNPSGYFGERNQLVDDFANPLRKPDRSLRRAHGQVVVAK